MKARSIRAFGLLVTLAVLSWIPAAGSAQGQTPAPSTDKLIFTVGVTQDMLNISPFGASGLSDRETLSMNYDLLLSFDQKTLAAAPGLAESWTHNENNTVWTFKIRDGVKWSDGVPLTAHDIAFTFNFILKTPPNEYIAYLGKETEPTFTAPDDQTFIWKTKKPTLAPLAPAGVPILPEHIWSKYTGDWKAAEHFRNVPAVGTGPFHLVEWKEGQYWRLEKNPDYWGGTPTIDEVVFRVYDNQEAMVLALKTGEIDFAEGIKASLLPTLDGIANVTTWEAGSTTNANLAFGLWQPSLGSHYKGFGGETPTNNPALLDPTVRIAIAKAIDKQALVDNVLQGSGSVGSTMLSPQDRWFWDPAANGDTTQDYNPQLANQMLDQAGYKDTNGDGIREDPKTGLPLTFTFLVLTTDPYSSDLGEFIKSWLKDIGMAVTLRPVTENKALDLWYAHDYDGYIWGWSGRPDPDFMLSIFTTDQCDNWSDGCYSNPEYDKLYLEQRAAMTEEERAPIVDQMQKIVYDQVPEVFLIYENDLQAYRNDRFTGFLPSPEPNGPLIYSDGPWSYINIKPLATAGGAQAPTTSKSSGLSPVVWIVIVVLILAIIGAVMLVKSRLSDEDVA
jgi:peptide/nickel transport system substrate-binding protein